MMQGMGCYPALAGNASTPGMGFCYSNWSGGVALQLALPTRSILLCAASLC